MGYAIYTARKMFLQSKVNDYNAKLMKIEQEKTKVSEQISANQAKTNKIDNAQNMMGTLSAIGSLFSGGSSSGSSNILSGIMDTFTGSGSSSNALDMFNKGIDAAQEAKSNAETDALNAKDKELDRQRQSIDTLLKQASTELQKVEDAESKAIEKSTAKYVA